MPELTPQERLQPALLDRLTDEEPTKTQEAAERRVMSKSRLRQAVLRDLAWLFNATKPTSVVDLAQIPHVRQSVVNFGLPALSGRAASSLDVDELERAIRQAILDFEPRILAGTLEVKALAHESALDHHNVVGVQIRGATLGAAGAARTAGQDRNRSRDGQGRDCRSDAGAGGLMDPRLLRHYNLELQHLREMGAEFAQQFPKVAARLGMSGIEVADPYVERLLEGFAFLAARVQLKLDAEFPRFTQTLLEIVYPHYLAPTPSMVVVQLKPDSDDPGLVTASRVVPRGTTMQSATTGDERTACEFRTAQDVPIWPIEVVSATYFSFAPDLPFECAADRGAHQGWGPHTAEDAARRAVFSAAPRPLDVLPCRRGRRGEQVVRAVPRECRGRARACPVRRPSPRITS